MILYSSVDPKTVQYLAGHGSSKITMDIDAKVKYNRRHGFVQNMGNAFAQSECDCNSRGRVTCPCLFYTGERKWITLSFIRCHRAMRTIWFLI